MYSKKWNKLISSFLFMNHNHFSTDLYQKLKIFVKKKKIRKIILNANENKISQKRDKKLRTKTK